MKLTTESMAKALAGLAHKQKFGVALDAAAEKTVEQWIERRWRDYVRDADDVIELLQHRALAN